MKKHIKIVNSYNIWAPATMEEKLGNNILTPALIIEWWLHNICYWLTKPFMFIPYMSKLNARAKDVDLMVEPKEG